MTGETLAALHATAFDRPWSAADFDALLNQSGVFVLDQPDGFILMRVVADEAEILTLAVRPEARRRGLASSLTRAAAARSRDLGVAVIHLEVAQDNIAARALYAAQGFVEAGRRTGYYARADGPPADALLLALNLPEALP